MATERKAEAVWQGDLTNGSGTILATTSGALPQLDVSWAARTEEPGGKTSPEDLIAAAWASCFAMALSNVLAKGGHAPEKLETSAIVSFQAGEGITSGRLSVRGTVAGISDGDFRAAAEDAKVNCPVSKALTGVPDVQVDASLAA